jgi:subtilase family serine protease
MPDTGAPLTARTLPARSPPAGGESERAVDASILAGQDSPSIIAAIDEVFLEMAIQGQSMFVAAGDSGAYRRPRR